MISDFLKKNTALYRLGLVIHSINNRRKIRKLKKYNDGKRREYIAAMYRKRTGKIMNWDNPSTYNEKMQWAKLYDSTEEKTICADKFLVRKIVSEKIGDSYLIPLLGVWNDVDEINFNILPNKYVLKVTNGSSTNIIVNDNKKLNVPLVKTQLKCWMKTDTSWIKGFELHYANITPRVIAEEFIETPSEDLPDYKFLCFNGIPKFCWVDIERYHQHKRNIYNMEWELQSWNQYNYGNVQDDIDKPKNFEEMVDIVTVLCKGFSHVRVDLYNIDGKIYFGEMTFTNGSGFELIEPDSANKMLGDLWDLDSNNSDKKF